MPAGTMKLIYQPPFLHPAGEMLRDPVYIRKRNAARKTGFLRFLRARKRRQAD